MTEKKAPFSLGQSEVGNRLSAQQQERGKEKLLARRTEMRRLMGMDPKELAPGSKFRTAGEKLNFMKAETPGLYDVLDSTGNEYDYAVGAQEQKATTPAILRKKVGKWYDPSYEEDVIDRVGKAMGIPTEGIDKSRMKFESSQQTETKVMNENKNYALIKACVDQQPVTVAQVFNAIVAEKIHGIYDAMVPHVGRAISYNNVNHDDIIATALHESGFLPNMYAVDADPATPAASSKKKTGINGEKVVSDTKQDQILVNRGDGGPITGGASAYNV